jgi:glycosyltransferase involved in cell wall biosynthesis
MKILLYNDTYKHIGGAETYCLELLAKLPKFGHEVCWLSHGTDETHPENHYVLPHFNQGKFNYFKSKYFFNPKAYQAVKEQLQAIRPDVVHLHHNRFYTFSVLKALKDLKIPTVQTVHDYTMLCPSQYYPDLYHDSEAAGNRRDNCQLICSHGTCLPMTQRIGHRFAHDPKRRSIRKQIPTFIAPSVQLKSYLEQAEFTNVHYLPFFIEEEQWSFNASRTMKNTVLFVGRVETNKGIYNLINAVLDLKKNIPNIQLMIAGTGDEYQPILEKIKAENLQDTINAVGFIDYAKIGDYYNQANVLVVPSLDMEQFGLIGIEGLASGIAVVGSNIGGIPEWCIHEKTGLLFEPENTNELKNAISRILTNDDFSSQLTTNGMQFIKQKYNVEQHFNGLIHHFENAKPMV